MAHPMVRLADCCEVVSGATPKTDVADYWGGEILWVTPKDIANLNSPYLTDTPDKITSAGYKSCSTQMLPAGAILVSSRAPIGHVAIAGKEMCTNQGFKSLVPGPSVHSGYLYHCMKFHAPRLAALGNGATFKEVSKTIVEDFEIPLPSDVNEQRRLAAILDNADAICRKRREALKLADEFLRAAFLDLFGDPVTNPEGWPEVPVKELASVTTGNTPSREVTEFYGDHIEWIKSDNINTPNHYLTAATEGLSEKGFGVGRWVPAGATLITCIAGSPACIGNAGLADRRVAFNQQINALTPKGDIEPEYLYALVLYSKRRIQAVSTEGMKGMVSKGSLENVRFISPDRALRQHFANVFHKVMKLMEHLSNSLNEAEALFQSLSHRAFHGTL